MTGGREKGDKEAVVQGRTGRTGRTTGADH